MTMRKMITPPTWCRWVGVRVARWRSQRVDPISRGRVSIGPIRHIGTSTHSSTHWLSSCCCRRQKMRKYNTTNLWQWWFVTLHTLSRNLHHVLSKLYSSSSRKDELECSTALPATCQREGKSVYSMCWIRNKLTGNPILHLRLQPCLLIQLHTDLPPGSALIMPLM